MSSHLLSKSSYIKGLQCEKHVYLYKHLYEEMDELTDLQKAIFKRGTNMGILAQKLFPGGILATKGSPPDYKKGLVNTKNLIEKGEKTIYEASFQFNDVLSIADIVIKEDDIFSIYEVKSSTSVSLFFE